MQGLVRLDQLLPSVRPELRGLANDGPAIVAVRRAFREFCAKTCVWRADIGPFDISEGETSYTLSTTYAANIRSIDEVRINTASGVADGLKGSLIDKALYTFVPPDTLELDDTIEPGEDVTDGLEVKAILVPNFDCMESPAWIVERHAEAIIAGALSSLFGQAGMPWYNPERAARSELRFRALKSAAMSIAAGQYRDYSGLEA